MHPLFSNESYAGLRQSKIINTLIFQYIRLLQYGLAISFKITNILETVYKMMFVPIARAVPQATSA